MLLWKNDNQIIKGNKEGTVCLKQYAMTFEMELLGFI